MKRWTPGRRQWPARLDHQKDEDVAESARDRAPFLERNPLAGPLLQRRAIGRDRLLEPRRPALPLAERRERKAEIVLRRRPVERNPLARPFLQRRAIGLNRLLEPRRPALPLAERRERKAEIVLRRRLVERNHSAETSPARRRRAPRRHGAPGSRPALGVVYYYVGDEQKAKNRRLGHLDRPYQWIDCGVKGNRA